MLQSIASYIWGGEEEELPVLPECTHDDQIEVDNDWILIPVKDKKLNDNAKDDNKTLPNRTVNLEEGPLLGTSTPQCLNETDMECTETDEQEIEEEQTLEIAKQDEKPVGARRQILQKRTPLKDLNAKVARKNDSPKNLKRNNKVHARVHSTRKNKQYGRMEGKHVGMGGKRAK